MTELTDLVEIAGREGGITSGELLPLVYDELRRLAASRMAGQGPGATLQATALVHEAWLKLSGDPGRHWADRDQFFKNAAMAMRSILVDRARKKASLKHGREYSQVSIDDVEIGTAQPEERILMIDDVLKRFELEDPESARLVTLKFFGGLTNQQIAEILGVSERTVDRQWAYARSWLYGMIPR